MKSNRKIPEDSLNVALFVFLIIIILAVLLVYAQPRIFGSLDDKYSRLSCGMSENDIISVLGRPTGEIRYDKNAPMNLLDFEDSRFQVKVAVQRSGAEGYVLYSSSLINKTSAGSMETRDIVCNATDELNRISGAVPE